MEPEVSTSKRLYSPGQIAFAGFLGSPIAACWLFARNYRQLGQPKSAHQWLLWGVVGTVILFIIASFLPDSVPNLALPIGYTVGFLNAAKRIHGSAIAEHLAVGGRLDSWWAVVGVGVLCLVIVVAVIVGVVLLLPITDGH